MLVIRRCIAALLAVFVASSAYATCATDNLNDSQELSNKGTAEVSDIYPTADQLPENLLRFYIYFSEPMSRENILSSISLLDSQGEEIPEVFLDNRYDLWSPDGTRLTLLLDPGRVKTGLVAHNRLGRAFVAGESYQLRIDAPLDAHGCELAASHTKNFIALPEYTTAPDIDQWQTNQPKVATNEPLSISLGRMIDHLSLAYRIRVQDLEGNAIRGALELAENEQVWRFTPSAPWQAQDYQIAIDATLEDVAGNRLSGLFDQPPSDGELEVPPNKYFIFFSAISLVP